MTVEEAEIDPRREADDDWNILILRVGEPVKTADVVGQLIDAPVEGS